MRTEAPGRTERRILARTEASDRAEDIILATPEAPGRTERRILARIEAWERAERRIPARTAALVPIREPDPCGAPAEEALAGAEAPGIWGGGPCWIGRDQEPRCVEASQRARRGARREDAARPLSRERQLCPLVDVVGQLPQSKVERGEPATPGRFGDLRDRHVFVYAGPCCYYHDGCIGDAVIYFAPSAEEGRKGGATPL